MNGKIVRVLTLSALALTLALAASLSELPVAHAATSGAISVPDGKPVPPEGSIGSVRYGPAAGSQQLTGHSSTTPQMATSAYCLGNVYAWKQTSSMMGAYSYTDCTPGAYEISQVIYFDHCTVYINGCQVWTEVTSRSCDTGTGGIYTEAYCPPNPANNMYIAGIGSGWLMRAHLRSCSDIVGAGWYCGWSEWDVQF